MKQQKSGLDEKNDISIKITIIHQFFRNILYFIELKHKNPEIIGKSEMERNGWFELRNLEKSPEQVLEDLMDVVKNKYKIKISSECFNSLKFYNSSDDLNEKDKNLMAQLNAELRSKFDALKKKDLKNIGISSIKIFDNLSQSNQMKGDVIFTFERASKSAEIKKIFIFEESSKSAEIKKIFALEE